MWPQPASTSCRAPGGTRSGPARLTTRSCSAQAICHRNAHQSLILEGGAAHLAGSWPHRRGNRASRRPAGARPRPGRGRGARPCFGASAPDLCTARHHRIEQGSHGAPHPVSLEAPRAERLAPQPRRRECSDRGDGVQLRQLEGDPSAERDPDGAAAPRPPASRSRLSPRDHGSAPAAFRDRFLCDASRSRDSRRH